VVGEAVPNVVGAGGRWRAEERSAVRPLRRAGWRPIRSRCRSADVLSPLARWRCPRGPCAPIVAGAVAPPGPAAAWVARLRPTSEKAAGPRVAPSPSSLAPWPRGPLPRAGGGAVPRSGGVWWLSPLPSSRSWPRPRLSSSVGAVAGRLVPRCPRSLAGSPVGPWLAGAVAVCRPFSGRPWSRRRRSCSGPRRSGSGLVPSSPGRVLWWRGPWPPALSGFPSPLSPALLASCPLGRGRRAGRVPGPRWPSRSAPGAGPLSGFPPVSPSPGPGLPRSGAVGGSCRPLRRPSLPSSRGRLSPSKTPKSSGV